MDANDIHHAVAIALEAENAATSLCGTPVTSQAGLRSRPRARRCQPTPSARVRWSLKIASCSSETATVEAVGSGTGGGHGSQEEDDEEGEEQDEDEHEEAGGEGRGRWGEKLVLVSTLADAVLPLIREVFPLPHAPMSRATTTRAVPGAAHLLTPSKTPCHRAQLRPRTARSSRWVCALQPMRGTLAGSHVVATEELLDDGASVVESDVTLLSHPLGGVSAPAVSY